MSMVAWLLISFAVLMFLGVPIGISLGLSAVGGMLFINNSTDLMTITKRMFEGMNSWALLAIPLYTFAGYTMSKGGISSRPFPAPQSRIRRASPACSCRP